MRRRGLLVRKILGIILGLIGSIIIIEFIPIQIWYALLITLLMIFFIILFFYL